MNYSKEEIDHARQLDIIDFLSSEGYTFKRSGSGYRCNEHNSLCVYADRKGWFWNSQSVGGATVIDYCTKIKKMTFPETLDLLVGDKHIEYKSASAVTEKVIQKPFTLPEKTDGKASRLFAYLCNTRKIDSKIVAELIKENKIYQDIKGNVVFVGFDEKNNAAYASIRGTLSDVQYRGDIKGSRKEYSFSLNGLKKDKLYVFEAPIDLLSHATLANIIINNSNAWKVHNRLSLAGTTDVALDQYLKNHPDVKELIFCLDNDLGGKEATANHIKKYAAQGYICSDNKPTAKDFNEELKSYIKKTNAATSQIKKSAANAL